MTIGIIRPTLLSIGLMSMIGCTALQTTAKQSNTEKTSDSATVYYNGNIITMEGEQPQMAEALVTQAGKIAYVGNLNTAQSKYKNAAQVNLNSKTLLPGFIDPHSHFDMVSNTMGQANLNPPPVGKIDSMDKLLQALKDYKKDNNIADGKWIYGWGYDESQLKEGRHPTKADIDKVLPNNPVYLQHTSGHMGVDNSKALAALTLPQILKTQNVVILHGLEVLANQMASSKKPLCIHLCGGC